jgi:hypothetical protein
VSLFLQAFILTKSPPSQIHQLIVTETGQSPTNPNKQKRNKTKLNIKEERIKIAAQKNNTK